MSDPIRAALERLVKASELVLRFDRWMPDLRDAIAAGKAALAEPVGELSPKEVEAQEAFTQMRDEILNGIEGFDNDQINQILGIIDDHTPKWV